MWMGNCASAPPVKPSEPVKPSAPPQDAGTAAAVSTELAKDAVMETKHNASLIDENNDGADAEPAGVPRVRRGT